MAAEKDSRIVVTEETRAVVQHYLEKQYARRAKNEAKKKALKKDKGTWELGKRAAGSGK